MTPRALLGFPRGSSDLCSGTTRVARRSGWDCAYLARLILRTDRLERRLESARQAEDADRETLRGVVEGVRG
jgi:hypothetical protein